MTLRLISLSAFILAGMFIATFAFAEDPPAPMPNQNRDLMPPKALNAEGGDMAPTHPSLSLTMDKSQIVRLDKDAVSVIVGNPAHLSVLLDTPRTLVLVPRTPGATFFTVLDQDSKVLMQRHVLVGAPAEKYVRVRRSCQASGEGCRPTSVYFCPDMCHEVSITQPEGSGGGQQSQASQQMPGGPVSSGDMAEGGE